jgi:putative tricarboxylic transport membrane protein
VIIVESFLNLLQPFTLIAMTLGVTWGIFMGATPGFGSALGMALLIPFTFGMDPLVALPMLAGVYAGAIYGGGITSILLGIPGTSAAAATIEDGFPMTQKGESNRALSTSVISSAFGGIFGGIILLFFAPMLAKVTLLFGPAEYFILAVFGLTIIASLTGKSILKGLICGVFGLLLGTIGLDPVEGESRFTYDVMYLYDGLPIIPVVLSLFAFPRCMIMIREGFKKGPTTLSNGIEGGGGPRIKFREIGKKWKTLIRSSLIGTFIGIIPGAGANIACWVSYAEAKRKSKTPEKFGKGTYEGVIAAEAANNAVEGGSMVPLLTLSIPGNSASAIMLGALLIHGMVPGPDLFTKYAEITYTYMVAVICCNFILLAIGYYTSRYFAKLVDVPFSILAPLMVLVTMMGSFAVRQYPFDMWITVVLGTICYLLTLVKFPMPPILLGIILGPIAERGFRRAMLISHDDWTVFFTRPICIVLLILTALSIYAGMKMSKKKKTKPLKE